MLFAWNGSELALADLLGPILGMLSGSCVFDTVPYLSLISATAFSKPARKVEGPDVESRDEQSDGKSRRGGESLLDNGLLWTSCTGTLEGDVHGDGIELGIEPSASFFSSLSREYLALTVLNTLLRLLR